MERLKPLVGTSILELRGKGLEIGIGLNDGEVARNVIDSAYKKRLHIIVGNENNLQIIPSFTISYDLLDAGLDIMIKSIKESV
jgi:4-aminobutyrate aminotransferase-like enzyme